MADEFDVIVVGSGAGGRSGDQRASDRAVDADGQRARERDRQLRQRLFDRTLGRHPVRERAGAEHESRRARTWARFVLDHPVG